MSITDDKGWGEVERKAREFEQVKAWIETLKPALKFRIAGKYANNAIYYLKRNMLAMARFEVVGGHFVAGEDGDSTFLPVRIALDDLLGANTHE